MSADRPQTADGHTVRLERGEEGAVATLWLDRPPLNVLDLATLGALRETVEGLAAEGPDGPRVLLVRGAGRCFSAGVAVEDHSADKIAEMLARFHGALEALRTLPAVTVAVVHGHCLGGGMELAAACDLAIAGAGARFGQPEIKLGCFPPYAAALYPARYGTRRTLDLLLTGRTLDAAEAQRWGFVNRVADDDGLDAAAAQLAGELAATSGEVARLTKKAVAAGEAGDFAAALAACEEIYLGELAASEDMREGIDAFLAKRPPRWRHR